MIEAHWVFVVLMSVILFGMGWILGYNFGESDGTKKERENWRRTLISMNLGKFYVVGDQLRFKITKEDER